MYIYIYMYNFLGTLNSPNLLWTSSEWNKMHKDCVTELRSQVQKEINAALTYLKMVIFTIVILICLYFFNFVYFIVLFV